MRLVRVAAPASPADRASPDLRRAGRRQLSLLRHELVHRLAVDVLAGELRHHRFHHAAHVFRRRRTGLGDRLGDGAFDRGRDRRRPADTIRARRFPPLPCRRDPGGRRCVNCSIESRRCLTSAVTTCLDSLSSSARPFSTSRFISAALSMRSALSRAAACWRIASVIAAWTSSIRANWCRVPEVRCRTKHDEAPGWWDASRK